MFYCVSVYILLCAFAYTFVLCMLGCLIGVINDDDDDEYGSVLCDFLMQVLRESLHVTGTGFHLVHDSSDTPGFMSTLLIAMTGWTVPRRLVVVRLRVVVEGVVFEREFEADVDLQYRFTWDRRNAYNQKVYGVVTAIGTIQGPGGLDPLKTEYACSDLTLPPPKKKMSFVHSELLLDNSASFKS